SSVTNMNAMLSFSGLDCDNYSATLVGWQVNNPTVYGITLDAVDMIYGTAALPHRNALINNQGWVINGDSPSGTDCGGIIFPCPSGNVLYVNAAATGQNTG